MRLDKLNMSEENQVHVFNNTTIAGDVVGRLSSILGYAIASLLIHLVRTSSRLHNFTRLTPPDTQHRL